MIPKRFISAIGAASSRLQFSLTFIAVMLSSCGEWPTRNNKPDWSLDSLKNPFEDFEHGDSDRSDSKHDGVTENPITHLLECSVTIDVYDDQSHKLGTGSGVFIHDYVVATAFHVVEQGSFFIITRNSDKTSVSTSQVINTDGKRDVALLRAELSNSAGMVVGSDYPVIGERIIVAGSPHELNGTITDGIVSQIREIEPGYDLIQISAPISPGSSGGPVMNSSGQLVGLSVGGIPDAENLNFMVPIQYAIQLEK